MSKFCLESVNKYISFSTVLPAKSDSDTMFCLQSYWGVPVLPAKSDSDTMFCLQSYQGFTVLPAKSDSDTMFC